MPETPASLLERLRIRPDAASWQRLVELYTPLIRNWLPLTRLSTVEMGSRLLNGKPNAKSASQLRLALLAPLLALWPTLLGPGWGRPET
jgi:hypothetical protein